MQYQDLDIQHLAHAGFYIKGKKIVYIDPFHLPANVHERADYIFVTHEHFDHCSVEDARKIAGTTTTIVTIPACGQILQEVSCRQIHIVVPGNDVEFEGVKARVVPAYNINKFRSPSVVFHPKADRKAGFVIEMQGVNVYHAGDTDFIPEMETLGEIDVALLPVSGTYVMTAEEAAEAAKAINPKLAIPMHYGNIVGSVEDAQRFKELASVRVEII